MTSTRVCILHSQRDLRIENQTLPPVGPGQVQVRVANGGICGSDLHYFQDGGFGVVRVKEPIILGHEIAGIVEAIGDGVAGLKVGQTVAVNPSHPCNQCAYCLRGQQQHCLDMRFMGSAMRMPHVQGAFRDHLIMAAPQCVPVGDASPVEAAFCEPLSVALHAVKQAGNVAGARVLITGCGPIGTLILLAARFAGAAEIVVTDLVDEPLAMARRLGASDVVNVAREADKLDRFAVDKGVFDVAFECSGVDKAVQQILPILRPFGTLVQVGVGSNFTIAMNTVVAKEITLRGTFRFHTEFALAAKLIGDRRIDVTPLVTHTRPLSDAVSAFEIAGDRRQAMKVQLSFT
jgi:L-idonate 5-dehydrogenase